jgi:hypothetical protein
MKRLVAVLVGAGLAACGGALENSAAPQRAQAEVPAKAACNTPTWVGGWATSVQTAGRTGQFNSGFADQTLRMILRPHAGGSAVRVHFSNAYGESDLAIPARRSLPARSASSRSTASRAS